MPPLLIVALMLSLGSPGPKQNDLRITIARVETPDAKPSNPEFAITLENQGEADWVLNLGFMLANGRTMFPTAVTLLLTDPSGGTRTLHFREPPGVAGRIDDYVVALRSHASYVLRVPLNDYRSTPDLRGPELVSGSYTIQARFEGTAAKSANGDTQGIRLLHFWTGVVSSNVLRFSVPEPSSGVGRSLVSPADRSTLIKALEDEAMLHRRHSAGVRRGDNPPPLDNPERLPQLAEAVGELHDPASIPALAAALGSGFASIRALAALGEQAVPAVLAIESSPESETGAVNHALITLRFIAEEAAVRGGLSAPTFKDVRQVAERRLRTGEGLATTTLWWAIDLAWTLQDEQLRRSVEALATDRNAVLATGIVDPRLIEQTQRRAAALIAGSPPLPRP